MVGTSTRLTSRIMSPFRNPSAYATLPLNNLNHQDARRLFEGKLFGQLLGNGRHVDAQIDFRRGRGQ